MCILTKLLSIAYCLFTKHPSVGTLPHAAVTDTLAKISYMAIHWREHRHSHSCSVSHSLAAFPEWLTSELLKFQHNRPSLVCSFVCIWVFIWPWFLMLIKRYLAYFQCRAYNFGYVFEQHPVSQDSHIDGFHPVHMVLTLNCSSVHTDLLLWTDCYGSGWVCTGFSNVWYWSPGDLWFWFWVYLGFSSISYWSPATDQQF